MTLSKTNEQAFEWLLERAIVGSTKEEREAAGLTDVDAQQPDAQQYYWGLPKDLDKKWAVDMRRLLVVLLRVVEEHGHSLWVHLGNLLPVEPHLEIGDVAMVVAQVSQLSLAGNEGQR